MQQIFVIGDSISLEYGPHLERALAGVFAYARKTGEDEALRDLDRAAGANGGDSSMVLSYLTARAADPAFRPDWMVINCGLHDIKRSVATGALQMPPAVYRDNLIAITGVARGLGTRLVWVRSTPVDEAVHNRRMRDFTRHAADLDAVNAVADAVMAAAGVRCIDLHGFTAPRCPAAFRDHVHYTPEVQALQGAFLAGHLLAWRQGA